MTNTWDPPDPAAEASRLAAGEVETPTVLLGPAVGAPAAPGAGPLEPDASDGARRHPPRHGVHHVPRLVVAISIAAALIAGAIAAIAVSRVDDKPAASGSTAVGTTLPGVVTTVPPPVTLPSTTAAAVDPAATAVDPAATTVVPTTTPPPASPVVGEHMVFHDGIALGQVTPTGFVPYAGDPSPQLRQGEIQVAAMSTLIESTFKAQVRPLDPSEQRARCPVAVQPRPASNAYPVGLWVEAPNWTFAPVPIAPVTFGPDQLLMVQTVLAAAGVPNAPEPTTVQAFTADLAADGVKDTVVAASYRDDTLYYRVVLVAPDGNIAASAPVFFEQAPSLAADGTALPASQGTVSVDAVAELTGIAPYELVIRVRAGGFAGATVRQLDGTELASWSCPA